MQLLYRQPRPVPKNLLSLCRRQVACCCSLAPLAAAQSCHGSLQAPSTRAALQTGQLPLRPHRDLAAPAGQLLEEVVHMGALQGLTSFHATLLTTGRLKFPDVRGLFNNAGSS